MTAQTTAATAPSPRPANDHPMPDGGARPLNARHTPTDPEPPTPRAAPCRNPACGTTGGARRVAGSAPARRRGYCNACYQRAKRAGFPAIVPPPQVRAVSLVAHICAECERPFSAPAAPERRFCSRRCGALGRHAKHPAPIPAGLSPVLRPDRAGPVWTGLALVKYPAPTWHTLRPAPPDGWRFAATDDAARAA
jgi:endogenous inhibitor of DNA gyrase (YacG/DUF329 family)